MKFNINDRFWSKVVKSESCWNWVGALLKPGKKTNGGYGMFHISASEVILAHRFSWVLHNGIIPKDLFVLHKCDNKSCVRPDHLFLGTHIDNMNDACNKNLFIKGDEWRKTHGL
jgi:hypothetical protein